MEDKNNWIDKGNTYLLQFKIADDATEEQRAEFESNMLRAVVRGVPYEPVPGVEFTKFFRAGLDVEEVEQSLKNDLFNTITEITIDALKKVKINEITKQDVISLGRINM